MNQKSVASDLEYSQAYQFLIQGDYIKAAGLYEQAIDVEPEEKSHYWYLGLALLLQGQETEAQTTWLFGMADGDDRQIEQWTVELFQILQMAAERQVSIGSPKMAWVIRQHLRELCPNEVNNQLILIQLAVELEDLTVEALDDLGVIQKLNSAQAEVDVDLLLATLEQILKTLSPDAIVYQFAKACLNYISDASTLLLVLLPEAIRIGHYMRVPKLAADLLELYRQLDPNNLEVLGCLATFYQNNQEFERGIEIARLRYSLAENSADRVFSSHLILRGLMTAGGYWSHALAAFQQHEQLLESLVAEQRSDFPPTYTIRLFTSGYHLPYFRDDLKQNRSLQNRVMQVCQNNVQQYAEEPVKRYRASRPQQSDRPLKIGYLSHCLGQHSVGWLARWLLQYHDRDRFQIHGYFINERRNDSLYQWYLNQVDQFCRMDVDCENSSLAFAEKIHHDEIDILVDLDSITLDLTCEILALKPAPIQVTWLGWDASGIPAIDYFIADPYVLPDWAQNHYTETIWRLPQTYIAVDGFEVGVPTLRRDELGIPEDTVIFFSGQKGYKRHPDTATLQMRILKEVPNSYFLIKGIADQASIQAFFVQIAEEEGVERDRLRFLPDTASEAIHRANLSIADVILDTYPYNGATTTLETLWMGIPLVTRVGEQFSSRNSYTMMVNAGISEGIAWSDAEYVEWGIRLGTQPDLRQQIAWKLRQAKHTAPLWNGKQFARQMEAAYQQMWALSQTP